MQQINEAPWDSELTACVASTSTLVDGLLAREGLTVLSPTPQVIVDAAKFLLLGILGADETQSAHVGEKAIGRRPTQVSRLDSHMFICKGGK